MTRQTSIKAYREIEANGLLEGLLWITYSAIAKYGPATQMEICRKINDPQIQDRSIMPRFAQLKKLKVIEDCGRKICSVTGRDVLQWQITDQLPVKEELKTVKKWAVLFITNADEEHLLFKSKQKAMEYKIKHQIPGVIHEVREMK